MSVWFKFLINFFTFVFITSHHIYFNIFILIAVLGFYQSLHLICGGVFLIKFIWLYNLSFNWVLILCKLWFVEFYSH